MELPQQTRLAWVLLALRLAVLELTLLTAFVAGVARRCSYGLVLLLHALSTPASWRQRNRARERT